MNHSLAAPPLSLEAEIHLAKQIEAGVIAAALLDDPAAGKPEWLPALVATGSVIDPPVAAELEALVCQGQQAKEELALANLGLVRVIVADLARRSWVNQADLFQDGCLILEQVIQRYDYRRGRFGAFAGRWIRTGLLSAAFPARREIAVGAEVGGDCPVEVIDEVHQALGNSVNRLPRPECRVLRLRHGWGGGQPATLEAVSARLGVSVAKVRRLERRALDRLRQDWLAMA